MVAKSEHEKHRVVLERYMDTQLLLDRATSVGVGPAQARDGGAYNYQASVFGTGTVSATVLIEVSNGGNAWQTAGSITLSGTDSAVDNLFINMPWGQHRVNVTAVQGTGAKVSVFAAGEE